MARLSPLRRRMIEDMKVRKMSPATQRSYVSAVSKFSRYFGKSQAVAGRGEDQEKVVAPIPLSSKSRTPTSADWSNAWRHRRFYDKSCSMRSCQPALGGSLAPRMLEIPPVAAVLVAGKRQCQLPALRLRAKETMPRHSRRGRRPLKGYQGRRGVVAKSRSFVGRIASERSAEIDGVGRQRAEGM